MLKESERQTEGKQKTEKERDKIIAYEKIKVRKIYILFRKQVTSKEGRTKTAKLRFAQYICAGDISAGDPIEGSQGSQRRN